MSINIASVNGSLQQMQITAKMMFIPVLAPDVTRLKQRRALISIATSFLMMKLTIGISALHVITQRIKKIMIGAVGSLIALLLIIAKIQFIQDTAMIARRPKSNLTVLMILRKSSLIMKLTTGMNALIAVR